jgi:hypothetical protein
MPPIELGTPAAASPPDLQLQIMLASDGRTLKYTLNSPDGEYNFLRVGSMTLGESPRDLFQRIFDRLSNLARLAAKQRTPGQRDKVVRDLADIGGNLYAELIPPKLKREYRALRAKHRGANLTITTNDPWIPWEIVRPVEYDFDGTLLYDDAPLCESFRLARWVAGKAAPQRLEFLNAVVVQPERDLPAARTEREYFAALRAVHPDRAAALALYTVEDTLSSFTAGQTRVYHFACHGNFDLTDPNDSALKLTDGDLTPSQITGDRMAGLSRARPIVFVNACHSGERAIGLTRLGGWAERFIAAGASAFIGSLWEINDSLASRFAVEFYNRILGLDAHTRLPIGEAFRQARLVLKALDPANPTWLAYVLYANPRAWVDLGVGAVPVNEPPAPQTPRQRPVDDGYARRLQDWLDHWQFTSNPFATWNADEEPSPPPTLLVDRSYIRRVRGEASGPASSILVGASGTGKTAAREAIWNDCTSGQVRAFPIRYTDFGFLLGLVEKDPTRLRAHHHVKAILRSGLRTLSHDVPTSFFGQLSPEDRALLQSMSRAFAGPTSNERLARLAPASASEIKWEDEEPAEILRTFVDLVTRPDSTGRRRYEAIYVLVDRVDAPPVGVPGALPLLRSLLLSGDLLDVTRVAFKLFLRPTIDQQLLVGSGVRRSRLVRERIEWDTDNLVEMVCRRLETYSNFNVGSIDQLCSAAAKFRVNELWRGHNRSPRELLMRLDRVLRYHLEHTGGPYLEVADIVSVLPAQKRA